MSTEHETIIGFRWFYSVLSNDTPLQGLAPGGVWRALVPLGTATPYVVMQLQSGGTDVTTVNGVRLMSAPLYQIKAVGPVSITDAIASAAAAIDDALGGKQGIRNVSVINGLILSCIRESPLENDELNNGEQWTNIGGLYRLQLQQA